jgi:hypothetical protein
MRRTNSTNWSIDGLEREGTSHGRGGELTSRLTLRDLRGFLNFPGAQAGRTYAHSPRGPFHQRANVLQIQVPAAIGQVVGMADPMPELRTSAAHVANSCHSQQSPCKCKKLL